VWPYSKGERDETAIFGEGGRRGPAEFRVIPEPQFRVLIQTPQEQDTGPRKVDSPIPSHPAPVTAGLK